MFASTKHRLTVLPIASLALILVGCQTTPKVMEPIRAVWVTRMDYKTPDDVVRIMDNCKSAGFNAVVFQVRGNGTVFYPSKIEPWAEQFDFQDPGFDPLALAVDEAHARDMQLHAWVNVLPAWQGPNPPSIPNQLYNTHPDWFWYDAEGNRQPLNHVVGDQHRGWYVSLNPCLPEVRQYLVDVFREIVRNYDVDGLHMDYIRFPNEPVVRGEKIPDYPRDARTLEMFLAETGQTPESDPQAWNDWRTEKVTELVRDIHRMMRRSGRGKAFSASVGAVRQNGLSHYQDGQAWIENGYIDMVFLMNYTPDVKVFDERIAPWLEIPGKVHIVPGMMVRGGQRGTDLETCQQLVATARERTGNYCVFAYSSIFGRSERAAERIGEFGPQFVAYLHGLAEADGN